MVALPRFGPGAELMGTAQGSEHSLAAIDDAKCSTHRSCGYYWDVQDAWPAGGEQSAKRPHCRLICASLTMRFQRQIALGDCALSLSSKSTFRMSSNTLC